MALLTLFFLERNVHDLVKKPLVRAHVRLMAAEAIRALHGDVAVGRDKPGAALVSMASGAKDVSTLHKQVFLL
jgi:hypothetical protein